MKKYVLAVLLVSSLFCSSCGNSNHQSSKTSDTTVAGNTDSSGSQPVQTGPGAANGGNATDTIGHENNPTPRTDSVVRH